MGKSKHLLEQILSHSNLQRAMEKVCKNKGSAGIDRMTTEALPQFFRKNEKTLCRSILKLRYRPTPVKSVAIKKDSGDFRRLGIPAVVDRMIQQAIAQVLTPLYESVFSPASYGYRPGRGVRDALNECLKRINQGAVWAVHLDISHFFDAVNHALLAKLLRRRIPDGRVITLILRFLKAGKVLEKRWVPTLHGLPQGSPLSPLLANIYLDELDRYLTQQKLFFVRYADDVLVLCKDKKQAEKALLTATDYLEHDLCLCVNREKTRIESASQVCFLGFGFQKKWRKHSLRIHEVSLEKMDRKIKAIQNARWDRDFKQKKLTELLHGWFNYYRKKCPVQYSRFLSKPGRTPIRFAS